MKDKLVSFQGVAIGYQKKILIHDINTEIFRGDRVLLLGANGTGKSTLLKNILKLQKPLKGTLETFYRNASYVPQNIEVPKDFLLTIEEVLELYTDVKSLFPVSGKYGKIVDVLKKTNLWEKKDLLLRECSGGELQRTFIARALLEQPDLLILDEPLNSIDAENQESFLELLKEIYDEYRITIIMTSHLLNESIISFFSRKLQIRNRSLLEL